MWYKTYNKAETGLATLLERASCLIFYSKVISNFLIIYGGYQAVKLEMSVFIMSTSGLHQLSVKEMSV